MRTCVTPAGAFRYGIHKPGYSVANLRRESRLATLGRTTDHQPIDNARNFPREDLDVVNADWIFEIPNPFPFRGCTYIDKVWADASAETPERIRLEQPPPVSLTAVLQKTGTDRGLLRQLPEPLLLALATCSTDPEDLIALAELSCHLVWERNQPVGLLYRRDGSGRTQPVIHNHPLFEAVANNPHLPDTYKIPMVIRPGAQGGSEIVGEWPADGATHVFEYLRRNSYIPGGHYAANMADDAIRYSIEALGEDDIRGLRHLYYQRSYVRLAEELDLALPATRRMLDPEELETLRLAVAAKLCDPDNGATGFSSATLWGWNFGFDFAPSRYRLHASHQQIHQQYALVPEFVATYDGGGNQPVGQCPSYSCGDLVAEVIENYRRLHGSDFFSDYRTSIAGNRRMDGRDDLSAELVVWRDEQSMLFVPKAQTSQWELQLMTVPTATGFLAGNIVECDPRHRHSLDTGMLMAQKAVAGLGAKMVTTIEYSKRLGSPGSLAQPLLYAFLPRLPESPGAFSEAQLRFISGHYPEDFAAACRRQLE
jgi:hypothetical protein